MVNENSFIFRFSTFTRKYKNIIINAIRFLIAVILIIFLVDYIKIDQIYSALKTADYTLIAAAFLLLFANIFFQYRKWKLICNSTLRIDESKKIFYSLLYGFTAGIATPFRVGEYFGRAIPFESKSLFDVILATGVDKFFSLLTTIFVGANAAILFLHYYYEVTFYITVSLFILILAIFYALFLLLTNKVFWKEIIFKNLLKINFLRKPLTRLDLLISLDKSTYAKFGLLSLSAYLIYTTQFTLLIAGFSGQNNYMHYYWVSNLVMFSKTIIAPLTFGELGIREGATVFFLGMMGFSQAAGFNSAVFLFIFNLVIPALAGLSLSFRKS